MRLRRVPTTVIVDSRIQAYRAGLHITSAEMESHVLAGGDVRRVINAMIAAHKANIDLGWQMATAIDLAGRDILDAVQTSVNPKVIDVPSPQMTRPTIDAVAKDGIQLKVKARVTVRTNIQRLVGGATEETIIARVGEGHRDGDRLGPGIQGRDGESGSHLQGRAVEGARCEHGV